MKTLRVVVTVAFVVLLSVLTGYVVVRAQAGQRTCGNEGEAACGLLERDIFNQACDTGLTFRLETCGCLLRGFFGNCLIPRLCTICRNDTRQRPGLAAQFDASWVNWALTNQREQLAVDEPLNWVMHLGTHNAFNSFSDGHQPRPLEFIAGLQVVDAPNHFYSMTDQLNLGSRMLALDTHWVGDNARLCHSFPGTFEELICLTPELDLDFDPFPSMRYFSNGVKEIRNWLRRRPGAIVILNLENYVDYTNCSGSACKGDGSYISGPLNALLDAEDWLLPGATGPLPSRAEMLAAGKRVVVIFNGRVEGAIGYNERDVVDGEYQYWLRNTQDFDNCVGNYAGAQHGPAVAPREKFTVVVEDRTLQQGLGALIPDGPGPFGHLSTADLERVARCNYTIVATDFLGSSIPLGRSADVRDLSRHEALVWTWKSGDRGQNGDCAMLEASSSRWVSSNCAASRRYVCAPPRSESGTSDRTNWDPREDRWRITQASGPWEGGPAACAAEFPYDPVEDTHFVFSVPVNGYQNSKLLEANTGNDDLWLNYTDQAREGSWVIPRLENVNAAPLADAGEDQTVECGTTAMLDGSGSQDPDGDTLTYTWTGPFGTLTGAVVNAPLGAGEHVVTLTVRDPSGAVGTDSVTVTVADTKPPSISVLLSPSVLWPPDGTMVQVTADVRAEDGCDTTDVLIELRSVVSSEPPRGHGGDADIQGADFGTGDLDVSLRAARSGRGPDRVYTFVYRAIDKAGNFSQARPTVVVPHDQRTKGGNRR